MSRKNKCLLCLSMILVIWLGTTIYFITQHSVIAREAKINEVIELEEVTIELQSMVLYNYERKHMDFQNPKYEFYNKVASKLPKFLINPYLRLRYLYSTPYDRDTEFYRPALYGKCIFTKTVNDPADYHQLFKDIVSIKVLDSADYGYSSSRGSHHKDDSLEIDFVVKNSNNLFPIERLPGGFRIIVKDLASEEESVFELDSQDFVTYKHNDLLGKEFPFRKALLN